MGHAMNIPATVDDCLVFEDWCEEMRLHPLEMTCTDSDDLWVLGGYGWGNGYGSGFGDGYGDRYGDGYGDGYGGGYGYGYGGGYRWVTR